MPLCRNHEPPPGPREGSRGLWTCHSSSQRWPSPPAGRAGKPARWQGCLLPADEGLLARTTHTVPLLYANNKRKGRHWCGAAPRSQRNPAVLGSRQKAAYGLTDSIHLASKQRAPLQPHPTFPLPGGAGRRWLSGLIVLGDRGRPLRLELLRIF